MRENSSGKVRSVACGSGLPPSARSVYRRAYRPIHRRRGRCVLARSGGGPLAPGSRRKPQWLRIRSMIKEVEFPSEGAMLRGLLFLPESQTKRPPLVIMAHGTSATVYMVADKYAEAFSRAGLAVLLYDHRNFGRSEGEPRQGTNPWIQCRGYRDAVKLVERLNGVDPSNANFDIIKGIISRGNVVGRPR